MWQRPHLGAVWGISTKQAAHLVNIPAIFWVVRPRGDRDRTGWDRRAGSRGGGAGLPGGLALALGVRGRLRGCCQSAARALVGARSLDRALALKASASHAAIFGCPRAVSVAFPRRDGFAALVLSPSGHASAGCSALRQV